MAGVTEGLEKEKEKPAAPKVFISVMMIGESAL